MKKDEKKILVLGTGKMGSAYIKKLTKDLGVPEQLILGVDIDAKKLQGLVGDYPGVTFIESRADRPISDFVDFEQVGSTILCTNTPSHHRLLVELMKNGQSSIFCEKPLALSMEGVNEIRKAKLATGANIFTAFLINLSEAVRHLIDRMKAEDLVLVQGSASWGKNRMYDSRPTPGDLEDEMVHPLGVLNTLMQALGLEINEVYIGARLSFLKYIDPVVQQKAHEIDPSFPLVVNSSSFVNMEMRTAEIPFPVLLNAHSSYIMGKQVRRVECTLSKREDPFQPVLAVEFNFDTKKGDVLEITRLQEKVVEEPLYFTGDKVCMETAAFLRFVNEGVRDPRLTGYLEARASVKVTDAIIRSNEIGGGIIQAIGEEDVAIRKIMNG